MNNTQSRSSLCNINISQVEPIVNEDSLYSTLAKAEEKLIDSRDLRQKLKSFYFAQGKVQNALAVENCGTFLMFKQYKDVEHTTKLDKANFCKSPLCPLCSWRRALKYSTLIDETMRNTKSYLYHLVLSVPSEKYITKEQLCNFKAKGVYFLKYNMAVTSYISNFEVTKSDKGFHPHLHILFESPSFIRVSSEYIKKMAGEWKNCYNRRDKRFDTNTFYLQGVKRDDEGLARELTKYALKADVKISLEDVSIMARAIHGVRRMSSGGNLKKLFSQAKEKYSRDYEREQELLAKYDYEYLIFNYINGKFIQH